MVGGQVGWGLSKPDITWFLSVQDRHPLRIPLSQIKDYGPSRPDETLVLHQKRLLSSLWETCASCTLNHQPQTGVVTLMSLMGLQPPHLDCKAKC